MKSWTVVSAIYGLLQAAAAVKHGTIGFGINMYNPTCCTSCYNTLSSLYLDCTTFSDEAHDGHSMRKRMDMGGPMGTTSPECRANNTVWLESLSYCIESNCDAEGVSTKKQEKCWQKNAAGGNPVPSLEAALPESTPIEEVAKDAEWLNTTQLANHEKWMTDMLTISEFQKSEVDHVLFSIIILAITVGAPVVAGAWLFMTASHKGTVFQSVRSYFSLPALFGGRHSEPLPWKLGFVTNQAMSTLIFVYVVLNIVFSSVRFQSIQPSSWFSYKDAEMAAYIGNRAGVLSFANMALAILFSTRNNPLLYFSGWNQTAFIALHRWTARMASLQAVVHSIIYTADYITYRGENTMAQEAAKPYWWWGIIATTTMSLMVGFSILTLRAYAYEVFLILHIALAILSLVGCWYHIILRFGKAWGYEVWLYIAFAFWAYDRLVRFCRLIYFSFMGGISHAQIESIPGTSNIVSLKLYPSRRWCPTPGQHSFIYFPSLGRFWENHPFTIADWGVDADSGVETSSGESFPKSSEKGLRVTTTAVTQPIYLDEFYVRFLFRSHGGLTSKLMKAMAKSITPTVLSEGAYGGHSPVNKRLLAYADTMIVIAGGIGVTYATSFAKQFAEDQKRPANDRILRHCQRFVLAWSIREPELLQYVQHSILPPVDDGDNSNGKLEYRFWLTGPNHASSSEEKPSRPSNVVTGHRMDIAATLGSVMQRKKKVLVLVCGPGGLADDTRREVVKCSKAGYDVELMEENFTW